MSWLIRFLFSWTLPFLKWIAPSMTGKDGEASGRKLSGVGLMILIFSTTGKLLAKENISTTQLYLLALLLASFLLLQGVITVQNIVDIMKNGGPANKDNPPAQPQDNQPK